METMQKDHAMPHFFNDILDLNLPWSFYASDSYKVKRRKIHRSVLVGSQCCNVHSTSDLEGDKCMVPYADFGVSGLPCTDMSRAGKQLKKHGPTNSIYMTHGKYAETMRVPLLLIECTPEAFLI